MNGITRCSIFGSGIERPSRVASNARSWSSRARSALGQRGGGDQADAKRGGKKGTKQAHGESLGRSPSTRH